MTPRALVLVLCAALAAAAGTAFGQPAKGQGASARGGEQMSREERQKLREDLNNARGEVYRDRPRPLSRPERGGRLTDEEREKLRRDILEANRDIRRR
jgi:uncharacterized membrane protein